MCECEFLERSEKPGIYDYKLDSKLLIFHSVVSSFAFFFHVNPFHANVPFKKQSFADVLRN